jgi:hypothetical protein
VLRLIGHKLLYARHDLVKECFAFQQCTEAFDMLS